MSITDRITERKWETKDNKNSIALLPCPFCGSTQVEINTSGGRPGAAVECKTCNARTAWNDLVTVAVGYWNRRA